MWDFEEMSKEFDREFERTKRMIVIAWVVYAVVGTALIGGGIYLLIRVLSFFGIL